MMKQNYILKIFAVVILFTCELKSQTGRHIDPKFINVELSISLDGSHKKDTIYQVSIMNLTMKKEKKINTLNKITLLLEYNAQYEITVTCKGYNTKIVELDTEGPVDKWIIMADVNLSNKNKQVYRAGKIAYDKESKTFKPSKKV